MQYVNKMDMLLLSDTSVPDLFIFQYMSGLSKEAICLYLFILSSEKSSFSEKDIEEMSVVNDGNCKEAIAELISSGLLAKNKSGKHILVDLKKSEVNSYCASVIAKGGTDIADLELSPLKKERDTLCESISRTHYLGKMAYPFYRIIDKCLFEYEFETLVIYSLFDTAKEKKIQYRYQAVEKLASEWAQKGIKDAESLSKVIEQNNRTKEAISLVKKITKRSVTEFDLERIAKWVDLQVDVDLIEYAFRCSEYKGTLTTKTVDDILSNWIYSGITSVADAAKYEQEVYKENSNKYKRRKASGNTKSYWRTGQEAGIVVSESSNESNDDLTDDKNDCSDDAISQDSILNMFGGSLDEDY